MHIIYPNISQYEYVEKENNVLDFTVETTEGETIVVSIDATEPKRLLAEGGTVTEFNSDVLGHLIYALEELK